MDGVAGLMDAGLDGIFGAGDLAHDPMDRRPDPDDREGEDYEENPERKLDQVIEKFRHGPLVAGGKKRTLRGGGEYGPMPINAVDNNAPAGAKSAALYSDTSVSVLNTPETSAPPGSIGHGTEGIQSQLFVGNPGGVGVGFGLGAVFDTSS